MSTPWFVDIYNFMVASQFPPEASKLYKEKLKSDVKYYIWDDPYFWRHCNDPAIHRSIQSSTFSIQHVEVVIMDKLKQPGKCLIMGPTGPLFSRRLLICLGLRTMLESRNDHKLKA
ncbi:hypothetical protein CR513_03280, partial [Mucuna pruriens]